MGTPQHGKSLLIPWTCPACSGRHSWEWDEIDEPFVDHPIEMQCEHCGTSTKMVYGGRVNVADTATTDIELDQQLAARVAERDTDCVICGTALDDYDGADMCNHCAEDMAAAEANNRDDPRFDSDDPVIREIARYREPRIQDGHRLAKHLYAGASALQDRLPGLATSMREAADALRECAE
jgi:hypothetical protein